MLKKKICKNCQNEFETQLDSKIFCSFRCKYLYRLRIRAKGKIPVEKICPNCKKLFPSNTGSTKIYCSDHCKAQNFWQKSEKVVINKRNCLHCGNEFNPKKENHRICSQRCSDVYYRSKIKKPRTWTPLVKPCVICGSIFQQKQVTQKFCSKKCKDIDNRKRSLKFQQEKRKIAQAVNNGIRNIGIPKDNIPESIFRRCNNCGSEMVYIGFDQCPICRGVYDGKRMFNIYEDHRDLLGY